MLDDYQSLEAFIRSSINDAGLEINPLSKTTSAIESIIDGFELLDWTVTPIIEARARFPRFRLISPDGRSKLSMIGGKVYRHPPSTEQICKRKHLTKRMLELERLPMPAGADFDPAEKDIAAAFFERMPKPAVVKPTDSGASKGVTVGVRNQAEFEAAWEHALSGGRSSSNVLIEQFVRGVELRAYVIGSEVVSVVARVQPYVIGDGTATVLTLVERLQKERTRNIRAASKPVVLDWDFVKKQGADGDTVLSASRMLFLNPFSYPTVGSFVIDVTESTSSGIKEIASRAKRAIPKLEIAGVDLLVGDIGAASSAFVVEVNTAAALDMHRYPTHGAPRSVDKDIVKYFQLDHQRELPI